MSKRLSVPKRTAKSTLDAYKAVRQVKERTEQKLDALLDSPFYKVFDFEDKDKHPYHALSNAGKQLLEELEALVAGVKDWHIGPDTLGDELAKIKANQIWNKEPDDIDLDALVAIHPATMTTKEAADKFLSVMANANMLRNNSTDKNLHNEIENVFGNPRLKPKVKKQLVSKHTESKKVDAAKECAAALKAIKHLGKHISRMGVDGHTIREEFETIKTNLDKASLFNTIDSGIKREKHYVDWFV